MDAHDFEPGLAGVPHRSISRKVEEADPAKLPAAVAGRTDTMSPGAILNLQRVAGNSSVSSLLSEKAQEASRVYEVIGSGGGSPLESSTRNYVESPLGLRVQRDAPAKGAAPQAQKVLEGEPVVLDHRPANAHELRGDYWKALGAREQENLHNAAAFVGALGGAFVEVWSKHVSQEMAATAAQAGTAAWAEVLEFVVLKTLAITASSLGGGAGVLILGNFGKALGKHVVQHAEEIAVEAVGESGKSVVHERMSESAIEKKKEQLDHMSRQFGKYLEDVAVGTIGGLPSITDYSHWLADASDADLSGFRLPSGFPPVPRDHIRATVAGVILAKLHKRADSARFRADVELSGNVEHFDDNIVLAYMTVDPSDGTTVDSARVYSPDKDLLAEVVGKAPISTLAGMAMRIEAKPRSGADSAAASQLMDLLRSPTKASPDEYGDFLRGFREENQALNVGGDPLDYVVLTRSPDHEDADTGGGLATSLWMYKHSSWDPGMAKLPSAIFEAVERNGFGESKDSTEDVSRPETAHALGRGAARALLATPFAVENVIAKYLYPVVPTTPVDRYGGQGQKASRLGNVVGPQPDRP